jgi:hypothetical protein
LESKTWLVYDQQICCFVSLSQCFSTHKTKIFFDNITQLEIIFFGSLSIVKQN